MKILSLSLDFRTLGLLTKTLTRLLSEAFFFFFGPSVSIEGAFSPSNVVSITRHRFAPGSRIACVGLQDAILTQLIGHQVEGAVYRIASHAWCPLTDSPKCDT